MASKAKLIEKVRGRSRNLPFRDLVAAAVGFEHQRTSGSHQIFAHPQHADTVLNLQPRKGQANPYQVRQLLALIDRYNLGDETD